LSLRRGIMLAVALGPVFIAALIVFLPAKERARAAGRLGALVGALAVLLAVAVVYAHSRYHWTPDNMVAFIKQGYDFQSSTEPGAVARSLQFRALIDAWAKTPIFGAGAGAAGATYIRDPAQPWAYELSYVALLYQTGLVGLGLYAAGVGWIYWTGIQMIRSGHELGLRLLPALTGMAAFLVANATNPYLAKFDYLWVIFLPVAYINLWLLRPPLEAADSRRPALSQPVTTG
jgi:O-antigen ligase